MCEIKKKIIIQKKMSNEIQCPECQGILILEGRITNYGLIWYFECNKCEKKFTESEIRKDN